MSPHDETEKYYSGLGVIAKFYHFYRVFKNLMVQYSDIWYSQSGVSEFKFLDSNQLKFDILIENP